MFHTALKNSYTATVMSLSLIIFSFISIKYFIPKTIVMVGNFPYPTEYYSYKKVIVVLASIIFLFVLFLLYYKLIISKLNQNYLNLLNTGYLFIILVSEIFITSIVMNPVVGDYAIIKQGVISFFEGNHVEI